MDLSKHARPDECVTACLFFRIHAEHNTIIFPTEHFPIIVPQILLIDVLGTKSNFRFWGSETAKCSVRLN